MPQLNSYQMSEIMYKILGKKKEITLEDIISQFEISAPTAYNVQRTLRMICEKHPEISNCAKISSNDISFFC